MQLENCYTKEKLTVILNEQGQNEHKLLKKHHALRENFCNIFSKCNQFFIYEFKELHVKKNKQNILIVKKSDEILIKNKIKTTLVA